MCIPLHFVSNVTDRGGSASILAHLHETKDPSDSVVFFFCQHENQESLQARTIIGSLAKQLIQDVSGAAFTDLQTEEIDMDTIVILLGRCFHTEHRVFILLDGLDECQESQTQEVFRALESITETSSIQMKLFWSCRPSTTYSLPSAFSPTQKIDLEEAVHRQKIAGDICKFLQVSLEESLDGETPKLQIDDPTLPLIILEHLEQEAHGMYVRDWQDRKNKS